MQPSLAPAHFQRTVGCLAPAMRPDAGTVHACHCQERVKPHTWHLAHAHNPCCLQSILLGNLQQLCQQPSMQYTALGPTTKQLLKLPAALFLCRQQPAGDFSGSPCVPSFQAGCSAVLFEHYRCLRRWCKVACTQHRCALSARHSLCILMSAASGLAAQSACRSFLWELTATCGRRPVSSPC